MCEGGGYSTDFAAHAGPIWWAHAAEGVQQIVTGRTVHAMQTQSTSGEMCAALPTKSKLHTKGWTNTLKTPNKTTRHKQKSEGA